MNPSQLNKYKKKKSRFDIRISNFVFLKGESLGKEIGCARYMEVSSKTGQGLADIFNQAVDLVIGQRGGPSGSISESGKSSHSSGGGSRKKKACTLL